MNIKWLNKSRKQILHWQDRNVRNFPHLFDKTFWSFRYSEKCCPLKMEKMKPKSNTLPVHPTSFARSGLLLHPVGELEAYAPEIRRDGLTYWVPHLMAETAHPREGDLVKVSKLNFHWVISMLIISFMVSGLEIKLFSGNADKPRKN